MNLSLTPTTSYNGRKIDLCFMPDINVGSSQSQRLGMTLGEERGGFVCAGHVKLAQKVMFLLFSPRFYTTRDGQITLFSLLRRGTLYYVRSMFETSFLDAAQQVKRFIQAKETDADPADERLASITLESWSVDSTAGKLEAYVSVQTFDISKPAIVVPLSIAIGRLNA